jgi:hypothetical protein
MSFGWGTDGAGESGEPFDLRGHCIRIIYFNRLIFKLFFENSGLFHQAGVKPLTVFLPQRVRMPSSSLEDTPPLPNALGPDANPALSFCALSRARNDAGFIGFVRRRCFT